MSDALGLTWVVVLVAMFATALLYGYARPGEKHALRYLCASYAALAVMFTSMALAAPPAQADADGYLRCVKGGLGGYVPDADALQLGREIGELLDRNQPPEAIVNGLYNRLPASAGFSRGDLQTIVACVQRNQPL